MALPLNNIPSLRSPIAYALLLLTIIWSIWLIYPIAIPFDAYNNGFKSLSISHTNASNHEIDTSRWKPMSSLSSVLQHTDKAAPSNGQTASNDQNSSKQERPKADKENSASQTATERLDPSKTASAQDKIVNFSSDPNKSDSQIATGEDVYDSILLNDMATSKAIQGTDSKSKKPRPLILYAFFETEDSLPNIHFFLRHALHASADFVFIMNGPATVKIPTLPNVRVIHRRNRCHDIGSYGEVLTKDGLWKKYRRFIMLNSSIRGPFFPSWSSACWSDVYLNKVTAEVKLVGMTAGCTPLPHIQSMIWATDRIGIETLLYPSDKAVTQLKANLKVQLPKGLGHFGRLGHAGINSCPRGHKQAVVLEIMGAPLIRAAGFQAEALMSAYHGIKDYDVFCRTAAAKKEGLHGGDTLHPGNYWGMDIHPFDTVFAKTHRDIAPKVLQKLTEWTDTRGYSSYDYC